MSTECIKEGDLERLKVGFENIKEYLKTIVGFNDAIVLMQEEVKGNKEFKKQFKETVIDMIKNELGQSDNLKSLQKISDKQIRLYVESKSFNDSIKEIAIESIKNEMNEDKSPINSAIEKIIEDKLNQREKALLIKIFSWFAGSITILLSSYELIFSKIGG